MKKLPRKFYTQPTLTVAQDLLGKFLVRKFRGKKLIGKIVETEAYIGQDDLACHAAKGMTERNKVMFGKAGHAYVYMIYGMYFCLNVVTEKEGFPAAVLIRALESVEGIDIMERRRHACLQRCSTAGRSTVSPSAISNGPGKLCQAMNINKSMNGEDLLGDKMWIEDRGVKFPKKQIVATKRVGIEYAGKCKSYPWRFYIKGNEFVSVKISSPRSPRSKFQ